jgi:hypothetical protein
VKKTEHRALTLRKIGLVLQVLTLLSIFALLQSCPAPFGDHAEASQVTLKSPSARLSWDPPGSNGSFGPTAYRIYCSRHRSHSWVLLGEVQATESPSYTIRYEDIGSGLWTFAVRAVYAGRGVSDLHTSLDTTADPFGGWYVNWLHGEE